MHPDKLIEQPDRETRKRRYARLNWNAHLVPVVREAVADFGRTSWMKGHALPQVALRSEAADRGLPTVDSDGEPGDSLTVQFGAFPGGAEAPAPAGHARPLIAAGRAALVFSQAASGAVAVFLYPAGTPAAQPSHIGDYRDPADLTRARVRRLVRRLFDAHCADAPRPAATVVHSRRLPATGQVPAGRLG